MKEIERKFLVKTMPDLAGIKKVEYERYFIYVDEKTELRIQRKNNKYEIKRKVRLSGLSSTKTAFNISSKEFEVLKKLANKSLIRESYQISEVPDMAIRIYHGDYEGLVRAEFEFNSEEEAKNFVPPEWCGREITDTDLGRDSRLMGLTREEFENSLKIISQ